MKNKTNIKINGKSFGNFLFTILNILIIIYSYFNFDLIGIVICNIIFLIPLLYLILKIINFKFCIENNKIIYRNIFGKEIIYNISDIKNINKIEDIETVKSIILVMNNNKVIRINFLDRNFDELKSYLLNLNLSS